MVRRISSGKVKFTSFGMTVAISFAPCSPCNPWMSLICRLLYSSCCRCIPHTASIQGHDVDFLAPPNLLQCPTKMLNVLKRLVIAETREIDDSLVERVSYQPVLVPSRSPKAEGSSSETAFNIGCHL